MTDEIASNPISGLEELETAAVGDQAVILDVSDTSEAPTGKVKRIAYENLVKNTPRVTYEVSSATPTINTDLCDQHQITALATGITNMTSNLGGTPTDGQKLLVWIKDNGGSQTINWGTGFISTVQAPLLTATIAGKQMLFGFIYSETLSVWRCVAVTWDP